MYQDLRLLLSNDQALTTTAVSTNAIDLEAAPPRQIGNGSVVQVRFQCTSTFTSGTSLNIQLEEDTQADMGDAPIMLVETGVIATASLVAGFAINLAVPIERLSKQFLAARYVIVGTMATATMTGGIWIDQQTSKAGWPAETGR